MPGQPPNVNETTRLIVKAGIAHRMLCESSQPHLPNDTAGCSFWVEVRTEIEPVFEDGVSSEVEVDHTSVMVQYPPKNHVQAFAAERGKSFGIFRSPPLNNAQMTLVERLANDYKRTSVYQRPNAST